MPMVMDLGFRKLRTSVTTSANKQARGTFLPRFGPPEGNTVRPACLGLIWRGCTMVRSQSLEGNRNDGGVVKC